MKSGRCWEPTSTYLQVILATEPYASSQCSAKWLMRLEVENKEKKVQRI